MKYYFCGIGGVGMSSIAQFLKFKQNQVAGSDRAFDLGDNQATKQRLLDDGIDLYLQDGSGVDASVDCFVVSTAVENKIPDVQKALSLGLPVKKRAEVLAEILDSHDGVAIGGTSGKTTVTAMTGHILHSAGLDPVVINGGTFINEYNGKSNTNVIFGNGRFCVIESDESDGTIELYHPAVAVVSNVSLDHKPIDELMPLFSDFVKKARIGAVVNLDCPHARLLKDLNPNTVTFSCHPQTRATFTASDIQQTADGVRFVVNGVPVQLQLPGLHNVQNALSAIAACSLCGVSLEKAAEALALFRGTKRRLEKIGVAHGVTVYDDYAHNPEKIAAAVRTMKTPQNRVFSIFQPHGFGPMHLLKDDIVKAFYETTTEADFLLFPEIFYQGGTVTKDISSKYLADQLTARGRQAFFFENRADIPAFIASKAQSGDVVLVMGARDNTLTLLAKQILSQIEGQK